MADQHERLRLVASEGDQHTKAEMTRAQPVQRAIKRRVALELRAAGLTYEQVAEQMKKLGYKTSAQGCQKIIENALAAMVEDDQNNVKLIRQMDIQRLDQVMAVLWPAVKKGDVKAIREYRQIIDQRARLIGTYAPTKHEIHGKIEGVLSADDKAEIKRLEEAFRASGGEEHVVDAEVVPDAALPAPPSSS